MKCEDCRPRLEDYFDGELDENLNGMLAQHLSACAACAGLYAGLEGEHELYLGYECDVEPAPDFWDNVMTRAAEHGSPAVRSRRPLPALVGDWLRGAFGNFNARRFSPSLTALLVVVAIGATVGVMRFLNTREVAGGPGETVSQNVGTPASRPAAAPSPESVTPTATTLAGASGQRSDQDGAEQPGVIKTRAGQKGRQTPAASNERAGRAGLRPGGATVVARGQTPDDLVREAEQKYVAAIAMLSRDVKRRRSRLDPETVARFERTLATVDRTIADTRQAARRHPGDPVAAQYMLTAYAKKVDVLREMVGY